jgi:HAD superfamily hydrolase (TIGR01490 family)
MMEEVVLNPRSLSVFDLDYTLVRVNTSFQFCRYLFQSKEFTLSQLSYSIFCYIQHRFFGMSLFDLHQKVFHELLLGKPLESLEKHVDGFIEKELSEILYMPAVASLRLAQHLGHYTLILSNSPSFLVRSVAAYFGVNEWRASEYGVDKELKLSTICSLMQGEDKAQAMLEIAGRLGIKKENITAYSDSSLDLPLLLAAGNAVAVNPDKKLQKVCQELNWRVL